MFSHTTLDIGYQLALSAAMEKAHQFLSSTTTPYRAARSLLDALPLASMLLPFPTDTRFSHWAKRYPQLVYVRIKEKGLCLLSSCSTKEFQSVGPALPTGSRMSYDKTSRSYDITTWG